MKNKERRNGRFDVGKRYSSGGTMNRQIEILHRRAKTITVVEILDSTCKAETTHRLSIHTDPGEFVWFPVWDGAYTQIYAR